MTELATGEPQAAQPVPEQTPAPAATPPATPAATEEEFIKIPATAFAHVGGDWHEVVRRSKEYGHLETDGWTDLAKQAGMTGHQLLEYWNIAVPQTDATATPATGEVSPQPAPQGQPALTAEQVTEIMAKGLKSFREESDEAQKEAQKKADERQTYNTGLQAEADWREKTLTELKIEAEVEGKPNKRHGYAQSMLNRDLNDIIASDIPDHWSDERRREARRAPGTEEQMKRATEMFTAGYKDFGNEAVAEHGKQLGEQAPTSLAGGPGGDELPKKESDMTFDEKVDVIMQGIDIKDGP